MGYLNDNLNPNLNEDENLNPNPNPNERRGMGSENNRQILNIIVHIEDYRELVDRNREVALKMGDWKGRILSQYCHYEKKFFQFHIPYIGLTP